MYVKGQHLRGRDSDLCERCRAEVVRAPPPISCCDHIPVLKMANPYDNAAQTHHRTTRTTFPIHEKRRTTH